MENDDRKPNDDETPEPASDRLTESIRQRLEALVPELVKKTFSAGMGAVFQTEDSIRKVAKEVNIPSVAGYIASSADATKDKVLEVIARETREFLEHINLTDEIAKLLTTLSFEIKTEVRFIPNSERFGGAEPDIKTQVKLKRDKAEKTEERQEDEDERPSRLKFWKRDEEPRRAKRASDQVANSSESASEDDELDK